MGDAKRNRGLPPRGIRPAKPEPLQRHVLAMIDRRIDVVDGEHVFSDHSAKPNLYASADLKTIYRWDGVSLRRQRPDNCRQSLDNPANQAHSAGDS